MTREDQVMGMRQHEAVKKERMGMLGGASLSLGDDDDNDDEEERENIFVATMSESAKFKGAMVHKALRMVGGRSCLSRKAR